jgi:UDPglucose 6-dehydrogenase
MFINIIGYGYVGSGMGYLCKQNNVDFCTYDVIIKDEPMALKNFNQLNELVKYSESHNETNYYIIAVPTPSDQDGSCDISIVERVLLELTELIHKQSHIIIKSTIKPGTSAYLYNKYISNYSHYISLSFCPEFLREKTFTDDIYNADFVLLGTHISGFDSKSEHSQNIQSDLIDLFKLLYSHNPNISIVFKSYEECELFKYTINVYLSVKVWYFNEISEICDKLNVKYDNLKSLFPLEPRIGDSHIDVPGHDGLKGFGGKCLPKETRGMCHLQQTLGIDNQILKHILQRNDIFRDDNP